MAESREDPEGEACTDVDLTGTVETHMRGETLDPETVMGGVTTKRDYEGRFSSSQCSGAVDASKAPHEYFLKQKSYITRSYE